MWPAGRQTMTLASRDIPEDELFLACIKVIQDTDPDENEPRTLQDVVALAGSKNRFDHDRMRERLRKALLDEGGPYYHLTVEGRWARSGERAEAAQRLQKGRSRERYEPEVTVISELRDRIAANQHLPDRFRRGADSLLDLVRVTHNRKTGEIAVATIVDRVDEFVALMEGYKKDMELEVARKVQEVTERYNRRLEGIIMKMSRRDDGGAGADLAG